MKYGFYSANFDERFGHTLCELEDGSIVKVTVFGHTSEQPLQGCYTLDDANYVGVVVKHISSHFKNNRIVGWKR